MEISVRNKNDVAIVDVRGEIIGDARIDFLRTVFTLIKDSPKIKGLIVNCDEVPMIDSVWLGMLCVFHKILLENEGKLVFLNANRSMRYMLIVTKLDQVFEKYDDEEEAVESFKK